MRATRNRTRLFVAALVLTCSLAVPALTPAPAAAHQVDCMPAATDVGSYLACTVDAQIHEAEHEVWGYYYGVWWLYDAVWILYRCYTGSGCW